MCTTYLPEQSVHLKYPSKASVYQRKNFERFSQNNTLQQKCHVIEQNTVKWKNEIQCLTIT